MTDYVHHKIVFAADKLSEVINKVLSEHEDYKGCPGLYLDFNRLVSQPPNMYHGHLLIEDEKDFPINWLNWNKTNWGTKWNSSDTEFGVSEIDGQLKAWIKFNTAGRVPYPYIAAFLNIVRVSFDLYYMSGSEKWWGYEKYEAAGGIFLDADEVTRTEKRCNDPKDHQIIREIFADEFTDEIDYELKVE